MGKRRDRRDKSELKNKVIQFAEEDKTVDLNFFEDIGLFTYKDKKSNEYLFSKIYLADFDINNKDINNIYDETGKCIAVEHNEKGGEIEVKPWVELDVKLLKLQILKGRARKKYRELELIEKEINKLNESQDEKAHELATDKAVEPKEEKKEDKTIDEEELPIDKQPELINWKNKQIKIGPKIIMDEIINGYYLWEILEIDKEIEGRIPKELNSKSFRTGFLSVVDSKELTAIDGKERKAPDIFVAINMNGDIIELDEQVLERQEQMPRQWEQEAEISGIDMADGKIKNDPETELNNTRTSLYKIPGVHQERAVSEDWYLSVDWNEGWKNKGNGVANGNTKEISIVQQSRNESYRDRELKANTVSYKLEAINEGSLTPEEEIQDNELREYDSSEAENKRKEINPSKSVDDYAKDIAKRLIKNHPEIYNNSDIDMLRVKAKKYIINDGKYDEISIKNVEERMDKEAEQERVRGQVG